MIIGCKREYSYGNTIRRTLIALCDTCGKKFERPVSHFRKKLNGHYVGNLWSKHNYCSTKCIPRKGNASGSWRGGRTIMNKRIFIKDLNHPNTNQQGYVMEHRLVMEKVLGRPLKSDEVVHHINQDTLDNREENLMLFKNNGEHLTYHKKLHMSLV